MFHDPTRFPFTSTLQANWRVIRTEFDGIRDELSDWMETKLYDRGWQVFGLFDFPHGEPIADNVARCPRTAALIQDHFPRHGAAGFSVLAPGTRIRPHEGYAGSFLRCHLGLYVPDGDCALEVAGVAQPWREGCTLVFDDRVIHRAWNATPRERVVLLIDFIPDGTAG